MTGARAAWLLLFFDEQRGNAAKEWVAFAHLVAYRRFGANAVTMTQPHQSELR